MSYRDTPEDIEYREREHHPICAWCKWSKQAEHEFGAHGYRAAMPYECRQPGRSPVSDDDFARLSRFGAVCTYDVRPLNGKGQCDNYAPSLSTRVRQLVKLRPFVGRVREGIVSQTPSGRVEYFTEHGHPRALRID